MSSSSLPPDLGGEEQSDAGLPDLAELQAGLGVVFNVASNGRGPVQVVDRLTNAYASTFPSEIVTCRFADHSEVRMLCKYQMGEGHNVYGHRGGVAYEAAVYRDVLDAAAVVSRPAFYGSIRRGGCTWLVVEYLDGSVRASRAQSPVETMRLAASWAGRFHATYDAIVTTGPAPPLLTTYDHAYYAQWAQRTVSFAGHWNDRLPWLAALCQPAEGLVEAMVAVPRTVVHGEFTPDNVLSRDGEVYPVDWESAALAMGEIDLACLIDEWPSDIAAACEQEYRLARWPQGAPVDFGRRLDLAKVYWDLRWLGDRPKWTTSDRGARFQHLREAAARLGFIP